MKYIMVTDFDNHGNRIEKNFTSYSSSMIKPKHKKGELISGTATIFIKKAKFSTEIETAWEGKVRDITKLSGKIFFRVEINKEIACPDEYTTLENGWYIES